MDIRNYKNSDKSGLINMFFSEVDPSYISHGELQMGMSEDGVTFTPDFHEKWEAYLERQIANPKTFIKVCLDGSELVGFVIFGISDDHDKEFGILYDIMIKKKYQGSGLADDLLRAAFSVFISRGIKDLYFESGANCHRAHNFYRRRGAVQVSNLYKIENIEKYMK